jgi:hypothetical protein
LFVTETIEGDDSRNKLDSPNNAIVSIFEGLSGYLHKFVCATVEVDGIEALGMLFVLEKFMREQLTMNLELIDEEVAVEAFNNASPAVSSATLLGIPGTAVYSPDGEFPAFLCLLLLDVRRLLIRRVDAYSNLQLGWIQEQVADPKRTGIFIPFSKLPALVDQIWEMTGGMPFKCVDYMFQRLCKKLFQWLDLMVEDNEKYADASKIQNYTYFEESMRLRGISAFDPFITQAVTMKTDAMNKYIEWMLVYELPILTDIGIKVDLASSKIGRESGGLELYIKR